MTASPLAQLDPATPADIPVLLELIGALAEFEHLAHAVTATEALLHASLFDEHSAEAMLARVDGKPVGFALWFYNYSTFLGRRGVYLEDLFVHADWRGKGIGRQLLAAVAAVAVAKQCGRMEWSVLDWNSRAICAYTSVGALPMDEWTVYRLSGEALQQLAATGSV